MPMPVIGRLSRTFCSQQPSDRPRGRAQRPVPTPVRNPGQDYSLEQIQKADPRARSKAAIVIAGGALLGATLILLGNKYRPAFEGWISQDAYPRLRIAFAAVLAAFAGPMLAFAAYFWRAGSRVVRAGRFPVPGAAVVRDTVVLRGAAARRRGRMLQICAVALVLTAAVLCALLWRLVWLVEQSA